MTVGAAGVPGNVGVNIGATLTGPRGNQISGNARDERTTFADVYYLATLKWNQGVNNFMWYVLGNIPSGTYDPTRLANLSIGYTGVDSGVGYNYLNPHTGHEFSAVAGFTYNGMNDALQYRNGIDLHFDWAMSQFVGKSVHVGIVGYVYQQLTGDSGAGAKLGDFKGHSVGIVADRLLLSRVRRIHGLPEHPRLLGMWRLRTGRPPKWRWSRCPLRPQRRRNRRRRAGRRISSSSLHVRNAPHRQDR